MTALAATVAPPTPHPAAWPVRLLRNDALVHAAVALVLAAPFFLFATIPLYDLPNHIARQHILFGEGAPGAGMYYAVHWRLIPNLAMEGVVFLLHPFVSVELAVRTCLAATVLQLFYGAVALNHALFGRNGRFALAAALFAYNGPLLFGFVNVCFGLGMTLWVFALWLRRRDRWYAFPLFALLGTLILVAHLFAFGVYALVIGAWWTQQAAERLFRRTEPFAAVLRSAAAPLHLAVPLLVYLALMPKESHSLTAHYLGLPGKLFALSGIAGLSDPILEGSCVILALAGAVLVRKRIAVAPAMALPLLVLVAAFLALPFQLGEGNLVDYRMPPTIMLFLVGSTAWRAAEEPWLVRARLFIAALLALHLGVLFTQWARWQPVYAEYRAAFAKLPPNAKLLYLHVTPAIADLTAHPPVGHIASLAVTLRGALIPSLFADVGHQLLVYKEPYRALSTTAPTAADAPFYDYILFLHPGDRDLAGYPAFAPIAAGSTFILGRLLH